MFIQINIVQWDWVRKSIDMVPMEHFFLIKSCSNAIAIIFKKIFSSRKLRSVYPKQRSSLFRILMIGSFLARNSGSGCQPRFSRGAYFTIFKVICRTLASRMPDLWRINFALNSLTRSVRIWRESIYGFAKAEIGPSRRKIRVGAALRYCSNGCLFARGFTG